MSELRKLEVLQEQLGEDATKAMEALTKEIEALKLAQAGMNQEAAETIEKLQAEVRSIQEVKNSGENPTAGPGSLPPVAVSPVKLSEDLADSAEIMDTLMAEVSRISMRQDGRTESAIEELEQKLDTVQESLNKFWGGSSGKGLGKKSGAKEGFSFRDSPMTKWDSVTDLRRMQSLFKTAAEDNIQSIRNYVAELKERVAKLHYQKNLLMDQVMMLVKPMINFVHDNFFTFTQVLDLEETQKRVTSDQDEEDVEAAEEPMEENVPISSLLSWSSQFQQKMMNILELWHLCHIPLLHRTRFYLFMTGDPADSNYLEVEARRLSFLWQQCQEVGQRQQSETLSRSHLESFNSLELLFRPRIMFLHGFQAASH